MKTTLSFVFALINVILVQAQQGTIDYKMTMTGGGKSSVSTTKMQFSSGKVRVETNLSLPGAAQRQVMLMLPDKPNTMIVVNDAFKTYQEIKTTSTSSEAKAGKVTVKAVGKEKIQGLNCTHVVVTMNNRPMDLWTTKDITGYENMLGYWKSTVGAGNDQLYGELKRAGAEGFLVKTQLKNPEGGMTMELVKYDTKPVAATAFVIPSGYKKGASFDPEKMKNMTPAERRKMMEEMLKQYGGKPKSTD